MTSRGRAVGDFRARDQHDDALGKAHHGAHDVLDQHDGDAFAIEPHQEVEDLVDLGIRQSGHGLVGDQDARAGGKRAAEFELAQLDLAEDARPGIGQRGEPDLGEDRVRRRLDPGAVAMPGGEGERDFDVLPDRHAPERARDLETARQAEPRPPPCRHGADVRARRNGWSLHVRRARR